MPYQMAYIVLRACKEIIHADHIVAAFDQPITQVTAEKSRAAGYEYTCHNLLLSIGLKAERLGVSPPCDSPMF
jgi:hypothetical protein